MAFSYSDKNFTVIGNLCFVHIPLDGTETIFDIPPAISDRILFNNIICDYTYYVKNNVRGAASLTPTTGFAGIIGDKIMCTKEGEGYLSFCFPIDSNK